MSRFYRAAGELGMDWGLRISDCGFRIADFRLWADLLTARAARKCKAVMNHRTPKAFNPQSEIHNPKLWPGLDDAIPTYARRQKMQSGDESPHSKGL